MTFDIGKHPPAAPLLSVENGRTDPRARMAQCLPPLLQPFLTWLTARPAPGEAPSSRPAVAFVWGALAWVLGGIALGTLALQAGPVLETVLLPASLLAISCGLGLFQVVVFHHASHGTVFATRETNRTVGRLISAVLLFKHFDAYQHEHMLHHSSKKLLTDEDEFADFVLGMCRLEPGVPKAVLWRRVLLHVVFSPNFHARFLFKRVRAALWSPDRAHNRVGLGFWVATALAAAATGTLGPYLLLWVLPVTVLLQVATVGRILCEHRFPHETLIAARGKDFVCEATAGVFPGSAPPDLSARSLRGFARWCAWWSDMLTVQLFVRLFVLVGDAPCHDFHHRRPATRKWTGYIHARQSDADAGCPGYPANYGESWGLFRALDENLASLARTSAEALR